MPKSNWKRLQDAVYEGKTPSVIDIIQPAVSPPPLPSPEAISPTMPSALETQTQTQARAIS
jgi:hypothetical protein